MSKKKKEEIEYIVPFLDGRCFFDDNVYAVKDGKVNPVCKHVGTQIFSLLQNLKKMKSPSPQSVRHLQYPWEKTGRGSSFVYYSNSSSCGIFYTDKQIERVKYDKK